MKTYLLAVTCVGVGAMVGCGRVSPVGSDASVVDVPTMDAESESDDDSDGVTNASDNCPTIANANQSNEDNDSFGDACDPCPIGPTATDNADSDGDGVGNGCDPEAGMMNRLEMFEGFAATMPPAGAVISPANQWSFPGGTAKVAVTGTTRAWLMFPAPNNGQNANDWVMAQYTIDAISNMSPVGAGLAHRFGATDGIGVVCYIGRAPDATPAIRILVSTDEASVSSGSAPFQTGQLAQVTFTRRGGNYTCADQQSSSGAANSISAVFSSPHVGLYTQGVATTYEWLMVISRAN